MKLLREMLHARIKLRENDSSLPMDLLDQIVDDMKTSGEEFLTESFVIVMLFATLLASFEPVSAVLSLAMVFLTDHPLVVNELRVSFQLNFPSFS